jgi:hypothetical protein
MKYVFVEKAVACAIVNVPPVVELRTVTGGNGTPVSQFTKPSNVAGLGELIGSKGEIPASSAAARVKILNV